MKILPFFIIIVSTIFANPSNDPWQGDSYAKNSVSQKESANDFLQGIKFNSTENILDVGCGDGKITAAIANAVPDGFVVGVDISPSMIDFARKAFSNNRNLNFEVQDAAKLNFTEKFDHIASFTVMQWVLEQAEALQHFHRALKTGGKLWIQMPTGLPTAMQKALEKTLESSQFKDFFTGFSAPWRFYQPDEYRMLLTAAKFTPLNINVSTKQEYFPSREAFQGFLRQWFPYLRPLPQDQKDIFLTVLLDQYLTILPLDSQGRVSFIVERLEVEAKK